MTNLIHFQYEGIIIPEHSEVTIDCVTYVWWHWVGLRKPMRSKYWNNSFLELNDRVTEGLCILPKNMTYESGSPEEGTDRIGIYYKGLPWHGLPILTMGIFIPKKLEIWVFFQCIGLDALAKWPVDEDLVDSWTQWSLACWEKWRCWFLMARMEGSGKSQNNRTEARQPEAKAGEWTAVPSPWASS